MDHTRKYDLEQLSEAIKEAKSRAEVAYYEKLAWRIMGESEPIRALRHDLMMAMRAGDLRAVKKIELHIQHIRQNETYGKSWGNNRGNKNVN